MEKIKKERIKERKGKEKRKKGKRKEKKEKKESQSDYDCLKVGRNPFELSLLMIRFEHHDIIVL